MQIQEFNLKSTEKIIGLYISPILPMITFKKIFQLFFLQIRTFPSLLFLIYWNLSVQIFITLLARLFRPRKFDYHFRVFMVPTVYFQQNVSSHFKFLFIVLFDCSILGLFFQMMIFVHFNFASCLMGILNLYLILKTLIWKTIQRLILVALRSEN